MKKNYLTHEVIHQDITRYQKLGFIRDAETAISKFIAMNPDILPTEADCDNGHSFSLWQNRALEAFYLQLNFRQFAETQRNNPYFKQVFIRAMLMEAPHTTSNIDKRLLKAFAEAYFETVYDKEAHQTPGNIIEYLSRMFPTNLNFLNTISLCSSNTLWNKLLEIFAGITQRTLRSKVSATACCTQDAEILLSDCYMILLENIHSEKIPNFQSVSHLRNYFFKILSNKMHEYFRRHTVVSLDEIREQLNEELEDEDNSVFPIDSPAEATDIASLFLDIFLNQNHPLHQQLVAKHEHDAELLLSHYNERVPYRTIVEKMFPHLSGVEKDKKIINIRKRIERAKALFKKRFLKMFGSIN